MEEPLILVTWLWSEFHGLILWMIGFYALWHLVVKPILRTIDNAREAKEDRINDRHIELINKLTDIETAIESLRPATPQDIEAEAFRTWSSPNAKQKAD